VNAPLAILSLSLEGKGKEKKRSPFLFLSPAKREKGVALAKALPH